MPSKKLNICVSRPLKGEVSETFIDAHINNLRGKVLSLYGGHMPTHTEDDSPLSSYHEDPNQALTHFLKQNSVDCFLAEYGVTGAEVMHACEAANVPLVVHFHGYDANHRNCLKKFESRYPIMFEKAAKVVAVSDEMKNKLIALGCPADKIIINPCGVNISNFHECQPQNNPPYFLSVGRFVDKKAPHLTILAFQKVLEAIPDARLIMAGDGILLESCKQLVLALNMGDSVELLGAIDHKTIPGLMRSSRALVQHSLTTSIGDAEGSPVSILEASATGLPIIATKHAGIPELVISGKTGILVDEHDIEGMAEAMIKLAEEPALANELGKNGRQRVLENFTLSKSIEVLDQVIQEVCG